MSIPFDIEERSEDAIVQLLRARIPDGLKVYAGFSDARIEYPCAVVEAMTCEPISEDAEWHGPRQINIEVAVITEAAPEMDGTGQVLRTSRERNQSARSSVLNALTRFDDVADASMRTLLAQVLDQGVYGVAFSAAQVMRWARTIDASNRKFITAIGLYVIAEPVELNP